MSDGPQSSDYLIVGAGIAGASLGWELAGENSVILLEAEDQPGFHATGRSAAFFTEIYGNELIRALTSASRSFFEQPPPGFTETPLLEPRGCLIFAGPDRRDALHAQYEVFRERSRAITLESADFAFERVPVLRRAAVAGCIWEPAAQRIDVHALLQGFLRGFRRRGGRLVIGAGVEALRHDERGWIATTPAGEYRGRVLVNAAGAWASGIAALAGAKPLELTPLRRTACMVEPAEAPDVSAWPAVTDIDESFYFIPDAGHLLLSPADETPAPAGDAYPDDLDVAVAVDRLENATTLEVRRVTQQWAGLRTFSADRSPVVGFDPVAGDFFWLAGQGGYGIQTSPALARLAAALLRGASVPEDLQRASIEREDLGPERESL